MESTIGGIFRSSFPDCRVIVKKLRKNQYRITVHTDNTYNREIYISLRLAGWHYQTTRIIGVKETGKMFYYKMTFIVTHPNYDSILLQNRADFGRKIKNIKV